MTKVVLVGDSASHPGSMETGGPDTDGGKAICRLGDIFNCSTHGANPIVSGTSSGYISDGKQVALNGAKAQCGAVIVASGSDSVL